MNIKFGSAVERITTRREFPLAKAREVLRGKTVAVLGYLSLVLLALQFKPIWLRYIAAALFLAFGVWAFASPYHPQYGRLWSVPKLDDERLFGLDV